MSRDRTLPETDTSLPRKKHRGLIWIPLLILFLGFCVWFGVRRASKADCTRMPGMTAPGYTEEERMRIAISLSTLAYGCEHCSGLSGTVAELTESNYMGILSENEGIRRTVRSVPATAVMDTAAFVREEAGDFRFLTDLRDEETGFYAAAFCDDDAGTVWIAYAGATEFRDTLAVLQMIFYPRLSPQEKQAFAFYETVLDLTEVRDYGCSVMFTGHGFGGTLASMVSLASGCSAVTVNGADGLAVDKFKGIEGKGCQGELVTNYMTSPTNGKFALMDLVQRMTFAGSYRAVDCHIFPDNGLAKNTHSAFSFLPLKSEEIPPEGQTITDTL